MTTAHYKKTRRQSLMEDDWSDLTLRQIAEVFDTDRECIVKDIAEIRKKYGVEVKYLSLKRGRSTVKQVLKAGDFSAMTAAEIAEELNTTSGYIRKNIREIEKETGTQYPYARRRVRRNADGQQDNGKEES